MLIEGVVNGIRMYFYFSNWNPRRFRGWTPFFLRHIVYFLMTKTHAVKKSTWRGEKTYVSPFSNMPCKYCSVLVYRGVYLCQKKTRSYVFWGLTPKLLWYTVCTPRQSRQTRTTILWDGLGAFSALGFGGTVSLDGRIVGNAIYLHADEVYVG